jgi:hypothetical protein
MSQPGNFTYQAVVARFQFLNVRPATTAHARWPDEEHQGDGSNNCHDNQKANVGFTLRQRDQKLVTAKTKHNEHREQGDAPAFSPDILRSNQPILFQAFFRLIAFGAEPFFKRTIGEKFTGLPRGLEEIEHGPLQA